MKLGSIAGADGGQAILSQVKVTGAKAGGSKDAIPVAQAIHGKKPKKQFTRCEKRDKSTIPAELEAVLHSQGRWDEASKSVRFVGGNQAAESEWGVSGSLLAQKAVHRGQAKLHSTAHACSALFLATCPGLQKLGLVMQRFFQECIDKADPSTYFTRSGWTGAGAPEDDVDAQRICASAAAAELDMDLDAKIRASSKKTSATTASVPMKRLCAKRPASAGPDAAEQRRRASLGLTRADCVLCTANFTCRLHSDM